MIGARPEPEDFDAFWRDLAARARAVPPQVHRSPGGVDCAEMAASSEATRRLFAGI